MGLDVSTPRHAQRARGADHEVCNAGQTRGSHPCELCAGKRNDVGCYLLADDDEPHLLGSNEIRVPGDGVVYAAPSLVPHYMVDHRYKPPDEFLDAAAELPDEQPPGWRLKRLTRKQRQQLLESD